MGTSCDWQTVNLLVHTAPNVKLYDKVVPHCTKEGCTIAETAHIAKVGI